MECIKCKREIQDDFSVCPYCHGICGSSYWTFHWYLHLGQKYHLGKRTNGIPASEGVMKC